MDQSNFIQSCLWALMMVVCEAYVINVQYRLRSAKNQLNPCELLIITLISAIDYDTSSFICSFISINLQVDVTNRSYFVDLSNYVYSGEWELLDISVKVGI